MMNNKHKYLLVDSSVAPDVFIKVIEVKKILQTEKAQTINDAVEKAGISRSAYYKYKDYIFPFFEMSDGKIITLFFVLEDISGVLSEVLSTMAKAKANILTINQNIPVNGIANITMSIRTGNINKDIEVILNELKNIDGIINIDILARE